MLVVLFVQVYVVTPDGLVVVKLIAAVAALLQTY